MLSTKPELFKVFVYGTLKEGFPNFYLNKGIKQNDTYITAGNYVFYLMTARHTPCLYKQKDKGEAIVGELFLVNQEQLALLDKLERTHELDGYVRTLISIKNQNTNAMDKAFIYLKTIDHIETNDIKVGPINCYTKEHCKLYQYRHKEPLI